MGQLVAGNLTYLFVRIIDPDEKAFPDTSVGLGQQGWWFHPDRNPPPETVGPSAGDRPQCPHLPHPDGEAEGQPEFVHGRRSLRKELLPGGHQDQVAVLRDRQRPAVAQDPAGLLDDRCDQPGDLFFAWLMMNRKGSDFSLFHMLPGHRRLGAIDSPVQTGPRTRGAKRHARSAIATLAIRDMVQSRGAAPSVVAGLAIMIQIGVSAVYIIRAICRNNQVSPIWGMRSPQALWDADAGPPSHSSGSPPIHDRGEAASPSTGNWHSPCPLPEEKAQPGQRDGRCHHELLSCQHSLRLVMSS